MKKEDVQKFQEEFDNEKSMQSRDGDEGTIPGVGEEGNDDDPPVVPPIGPGNPGTPPPPPEKEKEE